VGSSFVDLYHFAQASHEAGEIFEIAPELPDLLDWHRNVNRLVKLECRTL
jgi:hypothetical protein